jgi:hypothetical protein
MLPCFRRTIKRCENGVRREKRTEGNGGRESSLTDISNSRRNSNFNTTVSLLSQLALEQLVELSVEDSVGHELASLGDGALGGRHLDGCVC